MVGCGWDSKIGSQGWHRRGGTSLRRRGVTRYPWQLLGPAIAMTVFLFAMNFLGDGLRDALDPQGRMRV